MLIVRNWSISGVVSKLNLALLCTLLVESREEKVVRSCERRSMNPKMEQNSNETFWPLFETLDFDTIILFGNLVLIRSHVLRIGAIIKAHRGFSWLIL